MPELTPVTPTTTATTSLLDIDEDTAARDTRIERLFETWNLPFELEPNFALAKIKVTPETQIRTAEHRAPSAAVQEYVTHMKHGAIFPPIVLTSSGHLVDGNTRVRAAQELSRKFFPAYIVKFPHLGQARLIGAALNQMGGDRLTAEEIVVAAEAMMSEGYGDDAIARTLGRSTQHVRNVRRDQQFREAAERTGLADVVVPKQMARVLANIRHDEPFKAAVQAVVAAKPSAKDAAALVDKIEKTRSDAEALAVIEGTAQQWGPVTGPPPHGRSLSRSKAKKALSLVKALVALTETPADLVLPDRADAAELWNTLNRLSTNVCALYVRPAQ